MDGPAPAATSVIPAQRAQKWASLHPETAPVSASEGERGKGRQAAGKDGDSEGEGEELSWLRWTEMTGRRPSSAYLAY
jgi:hypothetical protein